ncbi:fibronectin type III domain-containing protein [Candidatus Sumerlaeota bacterium]|nr:fibronectin type III domain-containing protein [Candidatus Sumerlaeota bacterium]
MPVFPKKEADIVALADNMIAGYTANPSDFPKSDVAGLQTARSNYQTDKDAQIDAKAKSQMATVKKDGSLDALVAKMGVELKQSEVDTANDPGKLTQIGWDEDAVPSPSSRPGQPRALDPVIQGRGKLFLDWKAPAPRTGGTVRSYIVERREANKQGVFGEWHQVGVSLESEIDLTDQPIDTQLEYRIIAINPGGNSVPSNTAAVVL